MIFLQFQSLEGKRLQVIKSLSLSFVLALLICFAFLFVLLSCFWVSLVICFVCLHVFVCLFSTLFYFVLHKNKNKNWKIRKIQKQCVFVYIGTCVPWMAIEIKFSKICIFCSLDKHLYAQLSKWALYLLFVMRKIKLSLVLNTRITLFDGKD